MEEKLEKLLLRKAFKSLSNEEREYVLEHISETHYAEFRNVLGFTNALFNIDSKNVGLRPEIRKDLEKLYRKKHQRPFLKSFLINFNTFEHKDLTSFFRYATLGMICFFIGFLVLRSVDRKNNKVVKTTAMDIEKIPDFEQMNQYMYFDETGTGVEIIVP